MNSYQRVMNTLGGLAVDRLPVFAVLGAYGGRLTGTDLPTLFSDASAYVSGQQALQDQFGFDLVITPFDFSVIAEAFGGTVAWSAVQAPNVKRPAAQKASGGLSLPLPDPLSSGRLPMMLEATRQLAGIYKGQVPIISVLPGPCILPSLMVGMDQWIEAVLFDGELAQQLLEYSGHFFVNMANQLLEAGSDCLVITEGMATAEIAPRSLFAERFLPHLHSMFRLVQGPKVISSTGGSINQSLDLLPGLDGLVGVIAGSKDDLAEARRLMGPELTLIGNLDNLTIPAASVEEIYEMSLARVRTAAPSGRYILANAGADIPLSTPPENLRAMLAAGAAFSAERGCGK